MYEDAILRSILLKACANPKVGQCLDKLRQYDEYTYTHSYRVCILAMKLSTAYFFTELQLVELATAALLHDYGKMFVPIEIITKPGKLTEDEFNIVKTHSLAGAYALQQLGFKPCILRAVAEHHEGSEFVGYPFAIPFNTVSLYARLIEVADIADALISKRVYRDYALTPDEILEKLVNDIKVDGRLIKILEEFITIGQVGQK